MIDTIRLRSPFLSEDLAQKIEKVSFSRQGIDLELDEIVYNITTKELKGSYDSSLRIVVKRDEFKNVKNYNLDSFTVKCDCKPYLIVECSVHKLVLGHNIYNGCNDFNLLCKILVNFINSAFNVKLPCFLDWQVERVDYAEVFDLGSVENVLSWFRGYQNANFARRDCLKYGLTGLYFAGSSTTLKFYHKGSEFKKHDKKRLSLYLDTDSLNSLQVLADKLLRVEVEIKKAKLKYDFKKSIILVSDIDIKYLKSVYNNEVLKVIQEAEKNMKIVRKAEEVQERLYSSYNSSLAGSLLGTWYMLSVFGEEYAKSKIKKSTFYRHKNYIKKAGCSWLASDLSLDDNLFLVDFKPLTDSSYKLQSNDKYFSNFVS